MDGISFQTAFTTLNTVLFLNFLLLTQTVTAAQTDYCAIHQQHVLCLNKSVTETCDAQLVSRGLSMTEEAGIVNSLNEYRSRVARGLELRGSPGPQPPAANMRQLSWDSELSAIAQAITDKCSVTFPCSDCIRTADSPLGGNILFTNYPEPEPRFDLQTVAFNSPTSSASHTNALGIQAYRHSMSTAAYAQTVSGGSENVGCGFTMFTNGTAFGFMKLLICTYSPATVYEGEPVYQIGQPCSQCPVGTACSPKYPGLCAPTEGVMRPFYDAAVQSTGKTFIPTLGMPPSLPGNTTAPLAPAPVSSIIINCSHLFWGSSSVGSLSRSSLLTVTSLIGSFYTTLMS